MLNGTLDTFSVSEILELVGAAGATGVLHVHSDIDVGVVQCDDGAVTYAAVGQDADLGSLLVRGGFFSGSEWDAVTDGGALQALLERRNVDNERLQRYLATQTEESVFELDSWRDGELRLESDDARWLDGIFRYPTSALLESIEKRRGEWQTVVEAIGSPDSIVHQAPMQVDDDAEMSVSRSQLAMLSQIDGRRSVRELARDVGTGLFHTGKMVASLADIGLVVLRAERLGTNKEASMRHASNGPVSNGTPADRRAAEPPAPPDPDPGATPPAEPHVAGPAEFVEAGEGPARDLIVRLLSAVKEEL